MIIGLHGFKGSGKSEVAKFLKDECGFTVVKMASPLKNMLRTLYEQCGLLESSIERKIEGNLKESPCHFLNGKTPRHAMQTLGTEWGRDCISEDFWVDRWKDAATQFENVVADDLRFDNEAQAIKDLGGIIIHIKRHESASIHRSEAGISPALVDCVIENDSTISDLHTKILNEICPSWQETTRPLRELF